jgi:hypothetical protein
MLAPPSSHVADIFADSELEKVGSTSSTFRVWKSEGKQGHVHDIHTMHHLWRHVGAMREFSTTLHDILMVLSRRIDVVIFPY